MKKIFKSGLSLLLALTFVLSSAYVGLSKVEFSGLFAVEAKAANGIQEKINLIKTIYNTGSYFTSDGYSHNMLDYGVCPEDPNNRPMPYRTCKCSLSQIKKSTTGLYSGAEVASKTGVARWQCAAFAAYVFYNIFNKDFGSCGTVSIANAKLGDVVVFKINNFEHYGIYLYTSGSNVVVYDANSDYNCKVVYGSSYAKSAVTKVFRASNYDSVNNTSSNVNYVSGLAGTYYLQSKRSGYHLAVSEGKDASLQPINTWGTWWSNFKVKLTASGNGYKINFPEVSTLLVNPYSDSPANGTKINLYKDVNDSTQWWGFEKIGDAYVIRCLYNPNLVLTENGTNQATLTTYSGSASQLWYLRSHVSGTVDYNANGGTGAPVAQTKYYNVDLSLSLTTPTRSGYTFLGWATSKTATSASYAPGSSYTANSSITLYAVWKQNIVKCSNPTMKTISNKVTGVSVEWNSVSGADSYYIYRQVGSGSWSLIASGVTKCSYLDTSVVSGTVYKYKVRAYNKAGLSDDHNNYRTIKFLSVPKVSKVTNLVSGLKVQWNAVPGATKYYIHRRGANGNFEYITATTSTTFVDTEVKNKNGYVYWYTIKSSDGTDVSSYYAAGSANLIKAKRLSAPKISSLKNTTSGIEVKWNKIGGAKGYNVYRKTSSSGWKLIAKVTTTKYVDKSVKNSSGKIYQYTIRATYDSYISSYYDANSVNTPKIKRLLTPDVLSATSYKSGIQVKWKSVKGASGYYVYRKTTGGWQKIATVKGGTKYLYTDKTAKKGTTYTYTVKAYSGSYTSGYESGVKCKDKY